MNLPARTAIVMSRLPRLIDPQAVWLSALRAALRLVERQRGCLVSVDGTAGALFVRRGAERLGITLDLISGPVDDPADDQDPEHQIPGRDRLLSSAADIVLALGVRTNGNTHRVLRERLMAGAPVVLVDLPGLQSRSVRDDLIALGATCWAPEDRDQAPLSSGRSEHADPSVATTTEPSITRVCEIVPIPAGEQWAYLTHTTRACSAPWPEQASQDYIDALLDGSPDADHSPLASLLRIVKQRRLIASGSAIRGGFPVVCFTEVPLNDLPKLRQFQAHRARWDFEPFGICIRRDWLFDQGVRPVAYGSEAAWDNLAESDRPWFQLSAPTESDSADHTSAVRDWSVEREWRHAGDIDIRNLPADAGLLFVPDVAAAKRLTGVCPWPVTLWPAIEQ